MLRRRVAHHRLHRRFNLYYRALRGTPHKWLDMFALGQAVLPASCQVTAVNYYTARVSGRTDPRAPARQHAYLRALSTLPGVAIHYGSFLANNKWAGLVVPPRFKSAVLLPPGAAPAVAYVWRTEEKGSDVNLGVHLVRDAVIGKFDQAAVLTKDTDLVQPIRTVTQEVGLPVTLLAPESKPSKSLAAVATHVRYIGPYVGPCQLPVQLTLPNGKTVVKPASW